MPMNSEKIQIKEDCTMVVSIFLISLTVATAGGHQYANLPRKLALTTINTKLNLITATENIAIQPIRSNFVLRASFNEVKS
jgi:hypothetical protein